MICIYTRCKKEIPDDARFCPFCGRKQTHETKKKHRRANGSGSVYKNSSSRKRNKPWVVLKDGHSIGQCFATEREALEALAALQDVKDIELFNLTLEGVYDRWAETAYKDCKKSFKNDYTNAWKHVPGDLRSIRFRDVKADHMQQVIDGLFEAGKSRSVQLKVKSLFSFLCTYGMSNDLISKNYASFVKTHETERRKDDSTFSEAELYRVWRRADGPDDEREVLTARIIMIYLFTGMRLSELLPLPASSVHLDEEYPYLIGGSKTDAGRDRVVPIISTIRGYVQWFYDRSGGGSLFGCYPGNRDPAHWRRREYYPLLESLNIPKHTPHGQRRTNATLAVQARVDPAALQKIGGWREFETVQKYYNKPNVKYLAKEFEKLDSAFEDIVKEQEKSGRKNLPAK